MLNTRFEAKGFGFIGRLPRQRAPTHAVGVEGRDAGLQQHAETIFAQKSFRGHGSHWVNASTIAATLADNFGALVSDIVDRLHVLPGIRYVSTDGIAGSICGG